MKKATRKPKRGESIVGRGIGRRRVVNVPLPELLTDKKYAGTGFDRFARAAEAWAKETLERAGLPVAGGTYHLSDGKPLTPEETRLRMDFLKLLAVGKPVPPSERPGPGIIGGRMDVAKARGHREFEDDEWRAAALLDCLGSVRSSVERGDVDGALIYAVQAGGLFREFRIRDLFAEDSRNRAKVPERDPVISRWVAARLRGNPKLTLSDLREELVGTESVEIPVGDKHLYLEKGKIIVSGGSAANAYPTIRPSSLGRYLTDARKKRKVR